MESKLQLIMDKNKEIMDKLKDQNDIINRLVLKNRPSFLEPLMVKKSVSVPELSALVKKDGKVSNDWIVI